MAEIELVIKIPEEDFERCKKRFRMRINIMGDAIANGIKLPKGHGRLIDADALRISLVENEWISNVDGGGLEDLLDDAPTIIEAGTAESED